MVILSAVFKFLVNIAIKVGFWSWFFFFVGFLVVIYEVLVRVFKNV